MDLVKLGQVAGIAGIAVGAAVLLLRSVIEQGLSGLSPRQRGRTVNTIALGAFAIGLAGIAAWTFAGSQGGTSVVTHGAQSPGVSAGGSVSIGPNAPPLAATPTTTGQSSVPAGTRVETSGAQSPAVAAGGSVSVQSGGSAPASR